MKKILIISIFLFPLTIQSMAQKYNVYSAYKNKFAWLTPLLFEEIKQNSIKYNLPIKLICGVIHAESNGRNIISKKNINGTRDYGYMQINAVHAPNKNIALLLNYKINIGIGCWYLSKAYKKTKGDIIHTARLYNQGLSGNALKYKNWKYARKIKKIFLS